MKTLTLLSLATLLCGCVPARAATYYVDPSVASSGNGTSWTNAWKALSNVTGVKAGDGYLAKGGYSVSNWKPAGGSALTPTVYQIAQDAAHTGTATFTGSGTWLTMPSYCVVSGNAGDGAAHLAISGYSQAAVVNGTTGAHLCYVNMGAPGGSLGDGVDGQGVGQFELDHCYAYLTDKTADHFMSTGFNGTTWHQNLIHDNTIYIPHQSGASGDGADGLQLGGTGYSMYNNLVVGYDTTYTGGQHQDGWQSTGPDTYLEFYGNTFVNIGNYALFADAYWGGFNHVRVYNNIFLMGGNYVYPGGIVFGTDGGYTGTSPCHYDDILIANNIGDGFGQQGTVVLENPTGNTHPTVFTGDIVANNIGINGGHLSFNNNSTTLVLDNPFLTAAQGATNFTAYTATGGTNNNFRLLSKATSLIGRGTNLSSYFTTDKDGNARSATAPWDIGPYAFGTNSVVTTTNPPPADTNTYETNYLYDHFCGVQAATSATSSGAWSNTGEYFVIRDGSGIVGGSNQMLFRGVCYSNRLAATVVVTNPPPVVSSAVAPPAPSVNK